MKTKKFAKIAFLTISLALMVGAIFAMTSNAAESTVPKIENMNVEYTDKFCLVYAVPADTVSGGSATLYLHEDYPVKPDDGYIKKYELSATTPAGKKEVGGVGLSYEAYVFYTDGVEAMALDKVFYAQVVDAAGNASEVKSYSVVEYLYTRLADVDGKANTEEQNGLYKHVIGFGTYAQKVFLKADVLATTTLISDYCYVTTDGCTINGKTSAVLPQNKAFTVIGNDGALSNCTVTSYNTYDTTGTATEEEITGSSVTISGFYRAHIAAGASKTYKPGTENFEGYAVGDKPVTYGTPYNGTSLLWANWGTLAKLHSIVAEDTVYGKTSNVLPITFIDGWIHIYPVCNEVAKDEASAFEISFDIKMDSSKFTSTTIEDLIYCITYIAKGTDQGRVSLKEVKSNDGKWEIFSTSMDAKASEWNNIRVIFKDVEGKTAPMIEVYVNNDSDTPNATYSPSKNFTVADMEYIRFQPYDNYHEGDVTVYFDNIYCGFIE